MNSDLLRFCADLLGATVRRPACLETTACGAAFAAGLAQGAWPSLEHLRRLKRCDAEFAPNVDHKRRARLRVKWAQAVRRTQGWTTDLKAKPRLIQQDDPSPTSSGGLSRAALLSAAAPCRVFLNKRFFAKNTQRVVFKLLYTLSTESPFLKAFRRSEISPIRPPLTHRRRFANGLKTSQLACAAAFALGALFGARRR